MFPGLNVNVNCLEGAKEVSLPISKYLQTWYPRVNLMVDTGAPAVYHVSGDDSKFGTPIADKDALLEAIIDYGHYHITRACWKLDEILRSVCFGR